MATGAYDSNGIWQYGESDPIALFSDLLNLGMESTSDAFTDDRSRIAFLEQSVEQSSTFVASSQAARDSYWGIPSTSAQELALQNKGARTVRTDLGYTEQYFGAYNVSTNPGGRAEGAGWTPVRRQDGLVPIVPTSVSVATGTGSVNPLGQITFTGATAISLNGVFSSKYKNYRIVMNALSGNTSTLDVPFRFRVSGSDSAINYYGTGTDTYFNSGATGAVSNYGYWNIGYAVPTRVTPTIGSSIIDVFSPAVGGESTSLISSNVGLNGSVGAHYSRNHYNTQWLGTSFDGFTMWTFSSTFTGTIQVFGYND